MSDENTLYTKVAQNDETNPNTRSIRPPHVPSIANMQPFPSGSSVRQTSGTGKTFSDVVPLYRYRVTLR